MGELGYGAGYQYAHAFDQAYVPQDYLPEPLRGATWYEPTEFGFEKDIKKRMEWWAELKQTAAGQGNPERSE
jgi:putative ATPase